MTDPNDDSDDFIASVPPGEVIVIYDPGSWLPDEIDDEDGDRLLKELQHYLSQREIRVLKHIPPPASGEDLDLVFDVIGKLSDIGGLIGLGTIIFKFIHARNKRRRKGGFKETTKANLEAMKIVALSLASEGRPNFHSELRLVSIHAQANPGDAPEVIEQLRDITPDQFIVSVPDLNADETVWLILDPWMRMTSKTSKSGLFLPDMRA